MPDLCSPSSGQAEEFSIANSRKLELAARNFTSLIKLSVSLQLTVNQLIKRLTAVGLSFERSSTDVKQIQSYLQELLRFERTLVDIAQSAHVIIQLTAFLSGWDASSKETGGSGSEQSTPPSSCVWLTSDMKPLNTCEKPTASQGKTFRSHG